MLLFVSVEGGTRSPVEHTGLTVYPGTTLILLSLPPCAPTPGCFPLSWDSAEGWDCNLRKYTVHYTVLVLVSVLEFDSFHPTAATHLPFFPTHPNSSKMESAHIELLPLPWRVTDTSGHLLGRMLFVFLLKIFSYLVHMSILPSCISVHHLSSWCLQKLEECWIFWNSSST